MKTTLCSFVLAASQVINLHAQMPNITINAPANISIISLDQNFVNRVFIDVMNEHLTAAYNHINTSEMLTRKKSNTAAILLCGLAQTCAHIGSIFGADSKKDKHQGLFNVAGTVLNVASQLAAHSEKPINPIEHPEQNPDPAQSTENNFIEQEQAQMTSRLANLTHSLIAELEKEPCRHPIDPAQTLALIRSIKSPEERQALISSMLATPDLASQYLKELFSELYNFFSNNESLLVGVIKEKISNYLDTNPTITEQKLACITPEQIKSDVVIGANAAEKYSPEMLDGLTDGFIVILQDQVKQVCGIAPAATTRQVFDGLKEIIVHLYCTR